MIGSQTDSKSTGVLIVPNFILYLVRSSDTCPPERNLR